MKRFICCVLVMAIAFSMSACCLKHDWQEATCTQPKTCSKCGETEGRALGHDWCEATCTEPETCANCGKTRGEPLGHELEGVTCIDPGVCKNCGEKGDTTAGHQSGEPEVQSLDVLAAERFMTTYCTVCGEETDTNTEKLDSFIEDGRFIFTVRQFCERIQQEYDKVHNDDVYLTFTPKAKSGNSVCTITNQNNVELARAYFYDINDETLKDGQGDGIIYSIRIIIDGSLFKDVDTGFYLFRLIADGAIPAVDPSANIEQYIDSILSNDYSSEEGTNLHGLTYSCGLDDTDNTFTLDIEQYK